MHIKLHIPQKITAILVYGRPPLVFGGMLCAIAVMWTHNTMPYTLGVVLLFISMSFDLVDGWFAARFRPLSSPLSAPGAFYGQPSLGYQHDYSPGSYLRGHALFRTYCFPVYVFVSAISFGVAAHQAGCCCN